jgi:hypothetical protein
MRTLPNARPPGCGTRFGEMSRHALVPFPFRSLSRLITGTGQSGGQKLCQQASFLRTLLLLSATAAHALRASIPRARYFGAPAGQFLILKLLWGSAPRAGKGAQASLPSAGFPGLPRHRVGMQTRSFLAALTGGRSPSRPPPIPLLPPVSPTGRGSCADSAQNPEPKSDRARTLLRGAVSVRMKQLCKCHRCGSWGASNCSAV